MASSKSQSRQTVAPRCVTAILWTILVLLILNGLTAESSYLTSFTDALNYSFAVTLSETDTKGLSGKLFEWGDAFSSSMGIFGKDSSVGNGRRMLYTDLVEHDVFPDLAPSPNSAPHKLSKDLLEKARLQGKKWFVFKMAGHGLGSVLMNLFYKMLYMEEVYNRQVIVSETHNKYRRDAKQGVLTGYFTPQFPVVDYAQQATEILDPILQKENNITHQRFPAMKNNYMHPSNLNNGTYIFLTGHMEFRGPFKTQLYKERLKSLQLYHNILRQACPHLQWNNATQHDMQKIKDSNGVPSFLDTNSVAFHVRRGDKKYESRYYDAEEYVERFLSIPNVQNTTWEQCYVASDDADVVSNMTRALGEYGVGCTVYSMASAEKLKGQRFGISQTVHFMTELSILQEATLFVGSMNSNVGMLVSILRGCHQLLQNQETPQTVANYGGSYGVNTTKWMMF